MTNIYAFKLFENNAPSVFVTCDAQSTYRDVPQKDGDALKMVKRGWALISMTGIGTFKQVYDDIDDSVCYVNETAERLLRASEKLGKKYDGEPTFYIVVGFDENGPAMYEVTPTNSKEAKRGIKKIDTWQYSNGSGAQKVEPAIEREIEQGHLTIPDNKLEALTLCFAVGSKADQNLYVNDKLQVGVVSQSGARMITHPEIKLYGQEWSRVYSSLTGEDLTWREGLSTKEIQRRNDISTTIDEFYMELSTAAKRVLNYDRNVNFLAKLLKKGGVSIDEYEEAHLRLGRETHAFAPLVEAFTEGSLADILSVLRKRGTAREERYVRLEKP